MKNKKTITLILAIAMLILFTPRAKAVYQMSPNKESKITSLNEFMYKTRQMEANGGVMGLKEAGTAIKEGGTLLATSASNNIDVHMTKNTEFGACVILSASQKYGKQGTGSDSYIDSETSTGIATTTGNKYGVYQMGRTGNWEWTAGGGKTSYRSGYNYIAVPYNARYYNRYDPLTEKAGDATTSTEGWKGAGTADFVRETYAFMRGSDGAFSFYNNDCVGIGRVGRACAVCGSGF